jgi:hypothetical protein
MNFFTFISHVVRLQFKQLLFFFPGFTLTRKFEQEEKREGRLSLEKKKRELKIFDWLKIETLILTG